MALVWAVRILLYAQLLLGFDRFSGGGPGLTRDLHLVFGAVIGVLALVAFRPLPGLRDPGPRQLARFGPLVPLAIGLYFRFGGPAAMISPLVVAHVILAFASVAFVEVAAARQRRGMEPVGPAGGPAAGPAGRRR